MNELKMDEFLRDLEDIIKFVLRRIDLDNSSFAKQIKIRWVDEQIIVSMPEYGEYIDKGRKKNGKIPPIKSIVEFIRSKNIISTDLNEEQLAYAIANSIKRDGVKPKPFIEKLTEEIFKLASEHIYNEINKLIAKTFKK